MADMFAPLVAQLKANPKTIVFTEGNDPRILEAAAKLLAEGVLKVVMVGNEAECKAAAASGANISAIVDYLRINYQYSHPGACWTQGCLSLLF